MVVELRACLEIFYGFVARLLQPTFTTKWAGLGWACHSLAAVYIGPGLLLLLRDLQCCRPLSWGWPDCHRCRGGVEARDTVCSHSVLAWVSLCFRIRGFLVTAVQPPVPAPAPAWYRPWNWLEAGSAGSWLAEYGCMTAVTISTHRQYQSIGHTARWTLTSPPAQHGLISTNTLASGAIYFRAFICVLW